MFSANEITKKQYLEYIDKILFSLDNETHKEILEFILISYKIKYTKTANATLINIGTFTIEELNKLLIFLQSIANRSSI